MKRGKSGGKRAGIKASDIYDSERPNVDIPDGFVMVQDTREQLPLWQTGEYEWIIEKGLKSGDYSINGMENIITIERKSIEDLYGSFGGGRKRFERLKARMMKMAWAGLMIEGTEDEVYTPQFYSTMGVNQIYHAISSWEVDGIYVHYAGSKDRARDWIMSRLTRFYKHWRER